MPTKQLPGFQNRSDFDTSVESQSSRAERRAVLRTTKHQNGKLFRTRSLVRANVIALLQFGRLAADHAEGIHPTEGLAFRPFARINQPMCGYSLTYLNEQATVGFFNALMRRQAVAAVDEDGFNSFLQLGLVAHDRLEVVATLVDNLGGNVLLGSHGVDTDQKPLQIQGVKQHWNGSDFIALASKLPQSQHESKLGSNGADHVHWRLTRVSRTAQGLAVDGQLVVQYRRHAAHPLAKDRFETLGIESAKHAQKGVLRPSAARTGATSLLSPTSSRRYRLVPSIARISFVQKTRVVLFSPLPTRPLCNAMNANRFFHFGSGGV
jgi:hypothetical protein